VRTADWKAAYWLPAYVEKSFGYSPGTAALVFLGFSVAMTVGRWGTMFLPNTVGAIRLILLCVASAVLFSIASFAPIEGLRLRLHSEGLTESYLWPTDAR
jgi:fucose permease